MSTPTEADAPREVKTVCFQTIDARFSYEVEQLPSEALYRALLWDNRRPQGKRLRHSVINWSIPTALRKLKENIAESDFATDAEKEAAERIENE